MKLSNTAQYAIRILNFMAIDGREMFSAKYLIEKLSISDKYLRRIMTQLSKAQLIRAIQGRDGGYQFSKELNTIFLIDIINAIEDTQKYYGCVLGFSECSEASPCALHTKWVKSRQEILSFFHSTSLIEVIDNKIIMKF